MARLDFWLRSQPSTLNPFRLHSWARFGISCDVFCPSAACSRNLRGTSASLRGTGVSLRGRARALGVRRLGPLEAQNGTDAMPTKDFAVHFPPCAGDAHFVQYAALKSFCRVGAFCGFCQAARSGSRTIRKRGLQLPRGDCVRSLRERSNRRKAYRLPARGGE